MFFARNQVRKVAVQRMKELNDYVQVLVSKPELKVCREVAFFFRRADRDIHNAKVMGKALMT